MVFFLIIPILSIRRPAGDYFYVHPKGAKPQIFVVRAPVYYKNSMFLVVKCLTNHNACNNMFQKYKFYAVDSNRHKINLLVLDPYTKKCRPNIHFHPKKQFVVLLELPDHITHYKNGKKLSFGDFERIVFRDNEKGVIYWRPLSTAVKNYYRYRAPAGNKLRVCFKPPTGDYFYVHPKGIKSQIFVVRPPIYYKNSMLLVVKCFTNHNACNNMFRKYKFYAVDSNRHKIDLLAYDPYTKKCSLNIHYHPKKHFLVLLQLPDHIQNNKNGKKLSFGDFETIVYTDNDKSVIYYRHLSPAVRNYYRYRAPAGNKLRFCSNIKNPCAHNKCQNGSVCEQTLDLKDYRCKCTSNKYKGKNCEVDPCLKHKCQFGECVPSRDYKTYTCNCNKNVAVYGKYCAKDPCVNNQCQNKSLCKPSADQSKYTCECDEKLPYVGKFCNIDDPCLNHKCDQGKCVPTDDFRSYTCNCNKNVAVYGKYCAKNPCVNNLCQNKSFCKPSADQSEYTCECDEKLPYIGKYCSIKNPCIKNECKNGSECEFTKDLKDYTCKCKSQKHMGKYCVVDPCLNHECDQGQCVPTDDFRSYNCNCNKNKELFTKYCRENPCNNKQCKNKSVCRPNTDYTNFTCECDTSLGFIGKYCNIKDPCINHNCQHGECIRSKDLKTYTCKCDKNKAVFTENCISDPCRNTECLNESVCKPTEDNNDFVCECNEKLPFIGKYCDIISPCARHNCQNDSVCIPAENLTDYTCKCNSPKHLGKYCRTDPCIDNSCVNGDCVAIDDYSHYRCDCHQGNFFGNYCLDDPCKVHRCEFGTCVVDQNDFERYKCECDNSNIGGEYCNKNPCQDKCKDGICTATNKFESYTCECKEDYNLVEGNCVRNTTENTDKSTQRKFTESTKQLEDGFSPSNLIARIL